MKKLIITADDYGMSKAVNRAIDEGIMSGMITSTNVMTNMPFYMEANKLKESNASIGMHWVLTCGKPILSGKEIPTLVQPNGDFYSYSEFRRRYRQRKIDNKDIKKELTAQYKLFKDQFGTADYWNTHENFHVDYGIFSTTVEIAKELGICKMRSHQRIYIPGSNRDELRPFSWRILEPIKGNIINRWQNNAHCMGMKSPDGRLVFMGTGDVYKPDYAFTHIQWRKKEIGELVIHPATEADSPFFGEIVDRRIREYKLFTSDKTREILRDANIKLVNFESV